MTGEPKARIVNPASAVKDKAGEYTVKINSAENCNKNGNKRMCGMKHNYDGHKTDE